MTFQGNIATEHPRSHLVSTATVARRDRLDFWRDAVRSDLLELEFRLPSGADFNANMLSLELPELSLCAIESSPSVVERKAGGASRGVEETLMFNFVFSGQMIAEQDGRTVTVEPGDGVMCSGSRAYALRMPVPTRLACIRLPYEKLRRNVAGLTNATATSFAAHSELCGIVSGYASHLAEYDEVLSERGATKVADNFTDLLLAMAGEIARTKSPALSESRTVVLTRVKDCVERNLADFELDANRVEILTGLSHRYINRLFEAEQTSLSRYIWGRRLERTAKDLREAALLRRGISQIALANGFNDLSHFSKVFRARYGSSPRDYRKAAAVQ